MASATLELEPHEVFDYFALPREVRDCIYELLLIPIKTIKQRRKGRWSVRANAFDIPRTEHLLVSKQFTSETLECVRRKSKPLFQRHSIPEGSEHPSEVYITPVPAHVTRLEQDLIFWLDDDDDAEYIDWILEPMLFCHIQRAKEQASRMRGLDKVTIELHFATETSWGSVQDACLAQVVKRLEMITSIAKLDTLSVYSYKAGNGLCDKDGNRISHYE